MVASVLTALCLFFSGPFGGASDGRRRPGCQSFVPVVRKQAETAPLHLTVPLQLMCLTERHDSEASTRLCFVVARPLLVSVRLAFSVKKRRMLRAFRLIAF